VLQGGQVYFMLIADQMTRQEILFLSVIVVPIAVIILQEFALLMTDLAGDSVANESTYFSGDI